MSFDLTLNEPQMRLVLTALAATANEMQVLHAQLVAAIQPQPDRQPEPQPEPQPEGPWYPPGTTGWCEWSGGDCPVDPDTTVEFITQGDRDSRRFIAWRYQAHELEWSWISPDLSDEERLVAYRIVDDTQGAGAG